MRWMLLSGLLMVAAWGEEVPVADAEVSALDGGEVPAVDEAIPAALNGLADPVPLRLRGGLQMAVSAANAAAQQAVVDGLNHLHGGWEFEASRHFAMAMRADPDCLLAHWGMAMALLVPTPETGKARNAAVERMLDLLERGMGTELERGYAYGLIKYLEDGPGAAAVAFRKVSGTFPNDLQAAVFAALFARTGYDDTGEATPGQEQAEKALAALLVRHGDSAVVRNALLTIRAEGLDLSGSLEMARKLCADGGDYPPHFHLLGHYEWRCGNHRAAVRAFGEAGRLYREWMKANRVTVADCPEWVKAESYRIVALQSAGDFDAALAAAKALAAVPVSAERAGSAGTRMVLWEAVPLPARLLLWRGKPGDAALAVEALPKPAALKEFHSKSMAYWWIDAVRLALEARRQLDANKLTDARAAIDALTRHGEQMARGQVAASRNGERSAWNRAFKAVELLAFDARGRLSLRGKKELRGAAYNWFLAAVDRERPAALMYPPAVLSPAAVQLGSYQLLDGKAAEAVEVFSEGLRARPNDREVMEGLQRAYEAAKRPDDAAAVGQKLRELSDP